MLARARPEPPAETKSGEGRGYRGPNRRTMELGRSAWRHRAVSDSPASPAQQVTLDRSQMCQHRFLGPVGVTSEQRFHNGLVLAAIFQTTLLGERTLLHLKPRRLVAQDEHHVVDLLQE